MYDNRRRRAANRARTRGQSKITDLLERLRAFAVCLEQCTGAEVRNAYDAEMGTRTEQSEEQLCFVGLCLAEAKRRGLDTSAGRTRLSFWRPVRKVKLRQTKDAGGRRGRLFEHSRCGSDIDVAKK